MVLPVGIAYWGNIHSQIIHIIYFNERLIKEQILKSATPLQLVRINAAWYIKKITFAALNL